MKTRSLFLLLLAGFLSATLPLAAQTARPVIFPDEGSPGSNDLRLVWSSTPGLRYEVRQTTNLQSWTTAPGFPAIASGPAQQMPFATTNRSLFFRVDELDEQPPAIVSQYPQDGGFAVPRFADLTLQLSDVTGINTNSIRLTVGNLGTFTLTNPPPSATNAYLAFTNGILTFVNGGSIPMGAWGTNITATLIVADTLGNRGTNTWSFDLEVQPQVVTNLFVFGSPQAQRTGQQIGNIPTAVLAARFGRVPMGSGDPWTLEMVESNRLEISYTNTAPGFTTNTYVCNLTPAKPGDIFNRKIMVISNSPGIKRLTLFTVEVPLTEIATNASVSISGDSRLIETGTNGAFTQMLSIGGTIAFPLTGYSLDGTTFSLKNSSGFKIVNLKLEEEHWWLAPTLQVAMENNWGRLKRFEAVARGNIQSASIWNVDFMLAGVALETNLFQLSEVQKQKLKKWMLVGFAGPIPVFASLGIDVKCKGRAEVAGTASFRAGKRETVDAAFGLTYNKPDVQWVNSFIFPPPEVVPFTSDITVQGSVKVTLEPALEFLVYGLAGVSAGITPSAGVVFAVGTGKPLSGRLEAAVNLGLKLAGPAFEPLSPRPELSTPLWSDQWHLFPKEALDFTLQPQSQTVPVGNSACFSCTVVSTNPPSYQWYFNDVPLPGQTARTFSIPSVSYGHAGNYKVRASAGGQTTNSVQAQLTVVPKTTPAGMVLIPAGSFMMGNCMDPDEASSNEIPLHSVYVSAFYMDKTEVTKAQWDEVYNWAITNGYSFDNAGLGTAATHPVMAVSWYDSVKWCNARSQKDGLTPCYNLGDMSCNWSANGYRLPTEAEWEKAARGGASGQRFPWGNTITHGQANYISDSGYTYDTSPTRGYHPTFATLYTSPVGYFAPNGYGLYDMAGNVWEWCWDRYGAYPNESQSDPRGPSSGSERVYRGGSWSNDAYSCRTASREHTILTCWSRGMGFRSARAVGQ